MEIDKSKHLISIILPAYNAQNTIKRTLSSIAMQENIDEIETIIVDDRSNHPEAYDKIAKQFSHMMKIRVIHMDKNGGPGTARQVGFDHSNGEYIMWMDADDTLVSADTIKTLKIVMDQKNMDCVYGKFLEENEDGSIYPHEVHMVWMFGKLYRRSFLERYNIRFTTLLSNEDTSFNRIVCGCTDKIWYIPKDVYIWHFKANSITRIKNGMYGQDSGYKGWSDGMCVQILELQKRFVNRNYILSEIIGNMVTHYVFHEENRHNYPMNTEISLNWCRGFYHNVYEPSEKYITEEVFNRIAAQTLAGHNIAAKGIVPAMSLHEFMEEMKKPVEHLPNEETCGATPAGYIAPNVSPDWPCSINDYFNDVEPPLDVDSDTNHSRYGGMKQAIGIPLDETDYDMTYDGTKGSESIVTDKNIERFPGDTGAVGDETAVKCSSDCTSCHCCDSETPVRNDVTDSTYTNVNELTENNSGDFFSEPYNPNK